MTLKDAIRIMDDNIPPSNNKMVDFEHFPIAVAWETIKRELMKSKDAFREVKLSDFAVGDTVRLNDGVRHKEYAGRIGQVRKTVKSRNVVCVIFDDGTTYDALPENVELVHSAP